MRSLFAVHGPKLPAANIFRAQHDSTHFPQCRLYASMNLIFIGTGNGLSHVWRQAITWPNAGWYAIIMFYNFRSIKCNWKCRLPKWPPFCPGRGWVNGPSLHSKAAYTQWLMFYCFTARYRRQMAVKMHFEPKWADGVLRHFASSRNEF